MAVSKKAKTQVTCYFYQESCSPSHKFVATRGFADPMLQNTVNWLYSETESNHADKAVISFWKLHRTITNRKCLRMRKMAAVKCIYVWMHGNALTVTNNQGIFFFGRFEQTLQINSNETINLGQLSPEEQTYIEKEGGGGKRILPNPTPIAERPVRCLQTAFSTQ